MSRRRKPKGGAIGHNGGPPLDEPQDEHVPRWGRGGFKTFFAWERAHKRAWKSLPPAVAMRRDDKAEALGLTFEEYQHEILERGHFLQAEDVEAIARVKARRKRKRQANRASSVSA